MHVRDFTTMATTALGDYLGAQTRQGTVMYDAASRQAAMDELHTRALEEYEPFTKTRTVLREVYASLDTDVLNRRLRQLGDKSSYRRAMVLDELHARALAEYNQAREPLRNLPPAEQPSGLTRAAQNDMVGTVNGVPGVRYGRRHRRSR